MEVLGGLIVGELTGEDFGREVDVDLVAFLKNHEGDLFGGGRCGGKKRGYAVGTEGDRGESVSFFWGIIMGIIEMNKHR